MAATFEKFTDISPAITAPELLKNPSINGDFEEEMNDPNKSSFKKCPHKEDEDSVKGLMKPRRTPYQVMWDSQVGHERYRTTHDDYNAPKQTEEGVEALTVKPDECLEAGKYLSNGIWVRCTCDWHKKEAVDRSIDIEADYVDRYKSQIGKSLNPNHNIDSVPKGFAFGTHSQQASYGMEELTKDSNCPPCVFRRDFHKWIAALNKCRNSLKDRRDQEFKFNEFYSKSLKQDKEKTGFLPIDVFYDICAQENVTFHKEELESLLEVLHVIVDDKINYGKFIEIIDVTKPAIDIVPLHDLPTKYQYYKTSNQAACDYLITNNADLPPAGVPSTHDVLVESNVPHPPMHKRSEKSAKNPQNLPPAGKVNTHGGVFNSNEQRTACHNWSQESLQSPLNFKNN